MQPGYGAVPVQYFQEHNFAAARSSSSLIFFLQDRGHAVTAGCALTPGDAEAIRRGLNTKKGLWA